MSRLRNYATPPFPLWDKLPTRKRAAVLILLYADRWGDLRVVITMRAATLRSFPNQAALPGGKADSVDECAYETARREAYEEIGLPARDDAVPRPFRIQRLCYLEHHLARTHVVVRPCVALLDVEEGEEGGRISGAGGDALMPSLDANEVSAVFSASFEHFLFSSPTLHADAAATTPGHWYDGTWGVHGGGGARWRVHNFHVPVDRQQVAVAGAHPTNSMDATTTTTTTTMLGVGPDFDAKGEAVDDDERAAVAEVRQQVRYKVWGMTAHVLVDAARVAYGRDPEQEHDPDFGHEGAICAAAEGWELLDGG